MRNVTQPGLRRRAAAVVMLLGSLGPAGSVVAAPDFAPRQAGSEAAALVEALSEQGLPRDYLVETLSQARVRQEVLDAMSGAVERHLEWPQYRAIFLTDERIDQGAAFMARHQYALDKAQAEYGVPPAVITAIIGVETFYGRYKGKHRVLDSLATLAFKHPERGAFFRGELAAFLRIAHAQEMDPQALRGSYAGAMGYPQFIPTSYDAYAVDFDDDGKRDLWHNPVDAIGSVANYLAEHGWRRGEAVYQSALGPETPPNSIALNQTSAPQTTLTEAVAAGIYPPGSAFAESLSSGARPVVPLRFTMTAGAPQYRLGGYNFYVITRYNHSHLYAMAVAELARAIAAAAPPLPENEESA
ncbi:lytic murein transglycosylase B [Vreelandella jeotgali]|uniref:lytic murein transglycosylase B n=1 Tax=Vreelandella jeotgali TaxID=553386 RepID=UPI000346EB1C|nr:lytic murein transglycosylase B [Halomonas jeotgali]